MPETYIVCGKCGRREEAPTVGWLLTQDLYRCPTCAAEGDPDAIFFDDAEEEEWEDALRKVIQQEERSYNQMRRVLGVV